MSEGSYEYECSRAELLGVEKPTYEEYLKNKAETSIIDDEELETQNLAEVEHQNESLGGTGGKLDELNEILRGTQRKLNSFKASYSSLTNILKIKLGRTSDLADPSQSQANQESANDNTRSTPTNNDNRDGNEIDESMSCDSDKKTNVDDPAEPIRKSDLDKALDNQVNSLDSLINKAERAEISMHEQTSQMKKFLNFSFFNTGSNN